MKRLPWICATLTALLVLASCGKPDAADGYHFEQGSKMIDPRPIVVRTYPSYDALKAAYAAAPGQKRKLGEGEDLFAFSTIGATCTIHMIRPSVAYRPEEYGHELTHCIYGEWHPSQNQRG